MTKASHYNCIKIVINIFILFLDPINEKSFNTPFVIVSGSDLTDFSYKVKMENENI
jgi:hypothetical protein